MKELSLNILDVTYNSIAAGAKKIEVVLDYSDDGKLIMSVIDDGKGMDENTLRRVTDPFYTTRTTRKVGLGLPLLKLACEQTGGTLHIESALGRGTAIRAVFNTQSIDFTPIGDMTSTVTTLISAAPDIDFIFRFMCSDHSFVFSTCEVKEILGGISLTEPEVLLWIKEYLLEQFKIMGGIFI
ncbi:MAG: sensor histidine kinase [Clostridiales bacterium]|nr:sensor histidine kinase [Clostridiales bacterium]